MLDVDALEYDGCEGRLSVQLGASPADSLELRTNHLLGYVRLLLNGKILYASLLITGPDHATSGACPGEAEVEEAMDGPLVYSWSVLVGQKQKQRVVFRRKCPKWFAFIRPCEYEAEVDGDVVVRRRGF